MINDVIFSGEYVDWFVVHMERTKDLISERYGGSYILYLTLE